MTLTEPEIRHLHRLLGWVSCEIGQAPEEMVATVRDIAGKINEPIGQDAKARLVQAHAAACNVPHYVRTAVKALRKRLAAPHREPNWQPEFDAIEPEQERLVLQFCEEIAGRRGEPGSLPDPVRLLEMAEELYEAERDAHQRPSPGLNNAAPEHHQRLFTDI